MATPEETQMPATTIHLAIQDWIAASNRHNADAYLSFFAEDAVLDDPSVGRAFIGKQGIAEYFQSYFIEYETQTRLVELQEQDGLVHVEVDFAGKFPGGQTGGIFDLAFTQDGLIHHVWADLS